MSKNNDSLVLEGISTVINNRHAFVYERILELVVRETLKYGSVYFNKSEMARKLGCCDQSVNRAVQRLRKEGLIETTAVYLPNGAQVGNRYHATLKGIDEIEAQKRRANA